MFHIGKRIFFVRVFCRVAEPEPVEPKLFGDLEPDAENKLKYTFSAVSFEDARTKKS